MVEPQSRNEAILTAIIDGVEYTAPPQSRIEALLIELKAAIEESGGIEIDTQVNETSENPVQNKAIYSYVNSSVATNTAYFRGTFNSVADLEAYSGELTNNDYAFVISTDSAGNTVYNRYKYDGTAWAFEYALNNSSFTAAQWATIQSGLTAADKTQISTNKTDISSIQTMIGSINSTLGEPLNHNGIFRGKDLTNVYTIDQMYSMIHSGKFDDLFLGDYFTKSMTTDIYTRFTGDSFASGTVYYEMGGTLTDRTWTETEDTAPQTGKIYATKTTKTENVTLMFAAFDYYYNVGDTALTTHHAVLIPRGYGFATTAKMNSSDTTVGSYFNSDMHQIVLPCYAKALKTVLNNHLLAHRTILPNAINASTPSMAGAGFTGASNAWTWETVELQLMSEPQIYGTTVWSSSAYDVGADYKKLPVFDFINGVQFGRITYWLRSVVSSTNFAICYNHGNANGYGALGAQYVRPLILFG